MKQVKSKSVALTCKLDAPGTVMELVRAHTRVGQPQERPKWGGAHFYIVNNNMRGLLSRHTSLYIRILDGKVLVE